MEKLWKEYSRQKGHHVERRGDTNEPCVLEEMQAGKKIQVYRKMNIVVGLKVCPACRSAEFIIEIK